MVLKDYINYEKEIDHPLISISHFEISTTSNKSIKIKGTSRLSILVNIGNMVNIKVDKSNILFPPKNAFIIKNKNINVCISKGKFSKYTLIQFKGRLEHFLVQNLKDAFLPQYEHIIKNQSFTFDFPLNIDILTQLEDLYKTDFKTCSNFPFFELKSKSQYLIFKIMKKILFLDYKFIDAVATDDTKYYAVIKSLCDNNLDLENSLFLYNMSMEKFLKLFNEKNTISIDDYLSGIRNV